METKGNTLIRMFGALHHFRTDRGLEPQEEVDIPAEGLTAYTVAQGLHLPMEKIEGVFINHKAYSLDHVIKPGDRVAFIPRGIPGPHRFMLGIYDAGKGNRH